MLKNEIRDFFFARLGTGGNYDPTLLFEKRTERINVCKIWNRCGIYILKTQRCCFIYKFKTHKNGRYPSRVQKRNQRFLFHAVGHRKDFKVPSRYVAYTYLYKKIPWKRIVPKVFYYIFHLNSSLKWMNNAALEEVTNRGVLVNTSQVGNFRKAS